MVRQHFYHHLQKKCFGFQVDEDKEWARIFQEVVLLIYPALRCNLTLWIVLYQNKNAEQRSLGRAVMLAA